VNQAPAQEGLARALRVAWERSERMRSLITAELGPDASEWQRRCEVCGVETQRLDLTETTLASQDALTLVWMPCPECGVRERMARAGVPQTLLHATLDNWRVEDPRDARTLAKVREFVARPTGFLILASPDFGNGKTHLAVATLRTRITRGIRSRMMTAGMFLRDLRRRYDDGRAEDVVEVAATVPFLVFDEFGVSVGGKDEQPTLHDIFNERYSERLPTVITMNLTPDQFREAIGPRMASRLREATFAWLNVHGPSFRAGNRQTYLRGQ